jgi:thiol-disulfide isomerase/thioredoxin
MKNKIILLLLVLVSLVGLASCGFNSLSYTDFEAQTVLSYHAAEEINHNRHILYYYDSTDDSSKAIKTEILNFFSDFDLLDFYLLDTSNANLEPSKFGAYSDEPIIYVVSDGSVYEEYIGETQIRDFITKYRNIVFDYDLFEEQHLTSYDDVLAIENDAYILYYYLDSCPHCITTKPDFLPWAFTKNVEDIYFMEGSTVENADQIPTELVILNSGTPILVLMSNGKFADEYYSGTEEVLGYIETVGDGDIVTKYMDLDYRHFDDYEMTSHDQTLIISNEVHFEYFYSPYCSHCNAIKSTVLHFFSHLEEGEFYLMNASSADGIPKIDDFGGVPALYIIANNEVVATYKGSRSIPEFIDDYLSGKVDLTQYE